MSSRFTLQLSLIDRDPLEHVLACWECKNPVASTKIAKRQIDKSDKNAYQVIPGILYFTETQTESPKMHTTRNDMKREH